MDVKFSSKRPLTDEEEAEIQAMIASDPDNPELTDEQLAQMKPFSEVFPDLLLISDYNARLFTCWRNPLTQP